MVGGDFGSRTVRSLGKGPWGGLVEMVGEFHDLMEGMGCDLSSTKGRRWTVFVQRVEGYSMEGTGDDLDEFDGILDSGKGRVESLLTA